MSWPTSPRLPVRGDRRLGRVDISSHIERFAGRLFVTPSSTILTNSSAGFPAAGRSCGPPGQPSSLLSTPQELLERQGSAGIFFCLTHPGSEVQGDVTADHHRPGFFRAPGAQDHTGLPLVAWR